MEEVLICLPCSKTYLVSAELERSRTHPPATNLLIATFGKVFGTKCPHQAAQWSLALQMRLDLFPRAGVQTGYCLHSAQRASLGDLLKGAI